MNKVVRFSAGRACIQSMVYLQQHLEAGFAFPSRAEDIPAEKKTTYYFQVSIASEGQIPDPRRRKASSRPFPVV